MNFDWHNCYSEGWQNEIVPEAFSHPAKFSRALIRRIYAHALERGYLREGQTVLDPFGGVALGALDAMFHGLHYIGCELEDKFVQLGQQNIDLWNRRYGNGKLPRWGTATILQGDSRRLVEVLEGARVEGMISSPPYATQTVHDRCGVDPDKLTGNPPGPHSQALTMANYGDSDGQLGTMPTGEPPQVDGLVSSPPWEQQVSVQDVEFYRRERCEKRGRNPNAAHAQGIESYGTSPAQLGNMPTGEPPQAVIASPPHATSEVVQSHGRSWRVELGETEGSWRNVGSQYGDQDGQLAALPEGEPPAGIVSSPPWEHTGVGGSDNVVGRNKQAVSKNRPPEVERCGNLRGLEYGVTDGQLGQESGDTFWSAARAILLQCHAVLAPGGVAIWVLKAFVRNKAIVDFPGQWEALCNSCGFETVEVIRAWLVEDRGAQFAFNGDLVKRKVAHKSFFRGLYEAKARAAEFWKSVGRDDKARHLWQAHHDLWENRRSGLPDKKPPYPTRSRILGEAQMMAYAEAGKPAVEIDTQIDWEVVLITRKAA